MNTSIAHASDAQAVIDAAERWHEPNIIEIDGRPLAVAIPKGKELRALKPLLDEYAEEPSRKRGIATLTTLESFISHFRRYSDNGSVVFVDDDEDQPTLMGVYNYNWQGEGGPRFGDYGSKYAFPLSDEWEAWHTADGKPMKVAEFAEFLENRIIDVLEPAAVGELARETVATIGLELASPSKLLTLSRGLTVHVDSKVAHHTNLSTGEAQIAFETTHKDIDGNHLRVPGAFAVAIPVFRGDSLYQVIVRLRHRVNQGQICWVLHLHRADRIFRHAFGEAVAVARENIEAPFFYGCP